MKNPQSVHDLVVLPVELEFTFDFSTETKEPFTSASWRLKKSNVKLDRCEFVYNYQELGAPSAKKKDPESDEDFDDDEIDLADLINVDGVDSLIDKLKGNKRPLKISEV